MVDADALRQLAAEGLSRAELAQRFDVSVATVKRWLEREGIATRRTRSPAAENLDRYVTRECRHHGTVRFVREGRGYYRCTLCRSERVVQRRRRVREQLVAEAGGRCAICGYDRCIRALEFHHVDAAQKSFGVSFGGVTVAIDRLRDEARKCVLLCSNCHMEVESGVTKLARIPPLCSGGGIAE